MILGNGYTVMLDPKVEQISENRQSSISIIYYSSQSTCKQVKYGHLFATVILGTRMT
jgi:hypothetical protein